MVAVCVFCSASDVLEDKYKVIAQKTGTLIGEKNCTLVYGGSRSGLMGITADGALKAGAKAIGVIPEFLTKKEIMHEDLTEQYVVETMHERQLKMSELGDIFVILPGGMGTLAEFFEITTWKILGLHNKEIVVVNSEGYWTSMIDMIQKCQDEGFLHNWNIDDIFSVVDKVEDLNGILEKVTQ